MSFENTLKCLKIRNNDIVKPYSEVGVIFKSAIFRQSGTLSIISQSWMFRENGRQKEKNDLPMTGKIYHMTRVFKALKKR